ncbi:MAG: NB-ARC domain-containing protein [Chloroflexota bacterium]
MENNADLITALHNAFKAWYTPKPTETGSLLTDLQLVKLQRKEIAEENVNSRRLIINEVLLTALDQLSRQNEEASRLLRSRFLDGQTLREVAQTLNTDHHAVSRQQRIALAELAEVVGQQETALRKKLALEMEGHLPPPTYDRLFGVADLQAQLVEKLTAVSPPPLIALLGIGGIGKTSLADAAVRRVIPTFRFDDVAWLRLEHQTFHGRSRSPEQSLHQIINGLAARIWPDSYRDVGQKQREVQVRARLKQTPHLVVIDNLEAEEDTAYLLAHLHDLAGPSKFLLTTRSQPTGETAVFTLSLHDLSRSDAEALMRHHAHNLGISLAEATSTDFDAIYRQAGGNPLALKLVISQLRDLTLGQILDNLVSQQGEDVEALYTRIYRRTWDLLTPAARDLLSAMQTVAEAGADPDYLQSLSDLNDTDFWPAVQLLRQRSLLEARGTIHQKKYGIHRLTRTFLQKHVNP